MLFSFGTEISVFLKICKWWWWGGGGKLRRRCCVSSFSNCYFSDKIDQNGVRHSFNFHFSLLISKKRSKNGVKTLVWMIAKLSNVCRLNLRKQLAAKKRKTELDSESESDGT